MHLIDHINRNHLLDRERNQVLHEVLTTLRDQLEALTAFENRLIQFAQQITPYVDTKDLELAGILRRINEDRAEAIVRLEQRAVGLAGGIGGVSDELQKRWESMVARERRYEAQVYEVRTTLSTLQQSSLTLKRELERWLKQRPDAPPAVQTADASAHTNASTTIDSYKYVGFEDQFRGSPEQIRARLEAYLPYFEGASDVLDVGCGRGEFLDLLREHDIGGRGLDLNHEMVEVCRTRGLTADEGDALGYLEGLPDQSLGGLLAAQVVEHLEPGYLMQMLDAAYHKLRPRVEDHPRNDQPGVLVRLLRKLHPRRHARPPTPPGYAEILDALQRFSEGGCPVQRAVSGGLEAAGGADAGGCGRWRTNG